MSKVLVIHPDDRSTDFLKRIYAGYDYDVINDPDIDRLELIKEINNHDKIIMMGHGTSYGLLHPRGKGFIVDDHMADLFRYKETISIWCYSYNYFRSNNLTGFHTNMIISEVAEAYYVLGYSPLDRAELLSNMEYMADCFHDCIERSPEGIRDYMLENYVGNDDITRFNRESMLVC